MGLEAQTKGFEDGGAATLVRAHRLETALLETLLSFVWLCFESSGKLALELLDRCVRLEASSAIIIGGSQQRHQRHDVVVLLLKQDWYLVDLLEAVGTGAHIFRAGRCSMLDP